LPSGGTVTFNWVYSITTLIPDTPITFVVSYVNVTTSGLFVSQTPAATAIVRGPGGSSSTAGGNFQTAFGSIVVFFSSFQYSQDGVNWKSGSIVPGATHTLFRVNVTNLGATTIAFNSTSEIVLTGISSLGTTPPGQLRSFTAEFYIIQACTPVDTEPPAPSDATTTINCFTGGTNVAAYPTYPTRISVAPGATVTLYFGATTAGSAGTDSTPSTGVNALVVLSLVGNTALSAYPPANPPYAQATTVLVTRLS